MADGRLKFSFRRGPKGPLDPSLERLLVEARSLVEFPAVPDLSGVVASRLRQAAAPPRKAAGPLRSRRALRPLFHPAWQPVAVALVALIVLLSGTLVLSPTARRAVAGWLGLRGVRIQLSPSPSASPLPLGTGLDLGQEMTLAEAQARVPFHIVVPHTPTLRPPDAVFLRSGYFDPQVTLLWHARPGLPMAHETGEGLLLTEFQASVEVDLIKKFVSEATVFEPVRVNGGEGFWIAGAPHTLAFVDKDGAILSDAIRLAGNVLVWEQGKLTLRLEGRLGRDQALSIAASIR
jgi:hypothetical protein